MKIDDRVINTFTGWEGVVVDNQIGCCVSVRYDSDEYEDIYYVPIDSLRLINN